MTTPRSRSSDSANRHEWRRLWFPCALAVFLAGLVYLNVFGNPFVYDDFHLIVENRTLLDPLNVKALIWKDLTRPVANISFAIDRAIWGSSPFGFHLTNVLLHMLNVAMLFVLAYRLAGDRARAAGPLIRRRLDPVTIATAAAALFAVHPMMTQAVGYISGRSEVLCTAWFLGALLAVRRWMITGGGAALAAAAVLLVLALATKEVAVMFALVALACDRLVLPGTPQERARRLTRFHGPLLILTAAVAALRIAVLLTIEHGDKPAVLWSLLPVELDVVGRYLGMLILPVGQTVFHEVGFPTVTSVGVLIILTTAAGILLRAMRLRRADGLGVFGLIWFLLLLLPSSALVLLDHGEPMAEHRVYLASCGFFLAAGAAAGHAEGFVFRRRLVTRLVVAIGLIVGLGWLGARTILRNVVWGSPIGLWSEAVEMAPGAWVPRVSLGEAFHLANRHDEAIAQFATALQRKPDEPAIYVKLATCFAEVGRVGDARTLFLHLQTIAPASPEASNGLGTVSLLSGQTADARRYFLSTLERQPMNVAARLGLASVEQGPGGNPAEALRWCTEIKSIAPETPGNDECIRRNRERIGIGASPSQ